MKYTDLKKVILVLLVILITSGCQSTVTIRREGATPGLQVRDARMPDARLHLNAVAIIDPNLQRRVRTEFASGFMASSSNQADYIGKVTVENHGSGRSPTGTLDVFAVLRNRTVHPLQVECRVSFFNEQEIPVEGPTAWQRIFLNENGIGSCKQFSTQLNTSYYYIEIREGR